MSGLLPAGRLNRRITIQTAVLVQSASGEATFDWAHAREADTWAEWLPAGTAEAWRAQQRLASYVDGVFRIRDRSPRPSPSDTRIVFDGRTFDIKPYVELGLGEGLEIPVVARGE